MVAAGHGLSSESRGALESLCRTYWYPLYAYVRRRGHEAHEAEDLTQEFFARLLEKSSLAGVDRSKGRFRSFLLASLRNFLANEWDRGRAKKRGGGAVVLSIDGGEAETRYGRGPSCDLTPDKLFDRQWALAVLEQVLARLEAGFAAEGKQEVFAALERFLTGAEDSGTYAQAADRLGMTEAAVKMAVHRLRARYRKLLHEEIAQTVASPEEVKDEIRHLFSVLG